MPEFDRIDGLFVATKCTFAERLIFQRNGWQVAALPGLGKRWVTANVEKARPIMQHAIGAAKEHLGNAERVRTEAVAASWAEDTDREFPAPEGLSYMAFQKAGIEYAMSRENVLCADAPGLGKGEPFSAPVLTPTGFRPIGLLRPGESVYGSDGEETVVLGVFDRGVMEVFRVEFSDGTFLDVSEDHLWAVKRAKKARKYRVMETKEIACSLFSKAGVKQGWRVPLPSPIKHAAKTLPIPPYTMGYLLGDGCFSNGSVSFATQDADVVSRIESELPSELKIRSSVDMVYHITTGSRFGGKGRNPYAEALKDMGLWGKTSEAKFLPEMYLLGSPEQRTDVLKGLLDSDGSVSKLGAIRFTNNSFELTDSVCALVRSLGGISRFKAYPNQGGTPHSWAQITIDVCPFHTQRKVGRYCKYIERPATKIIRNVYSTGRFEEIRCIKVAAKDGLYVSGDYTVTHNTIQAIGTHNTMASENILVVCPASLKVNWSREWRRWDVHGRSVGIAMSVLKREPIFDENGERLRDHNNRPAYRSWTEHDWPDTDVVIVNYDQLETYDDYIKGKTWDFAVFDEAHLLKTPTSVRTMCVFGGSKNARKKDGKVIDKKKRLRPIRAKRKFFATGTPILSKPVELWTLLKACDPHGLGKNWEEFVHRYCGAYDEMVSDTQSRLVTDGASNLDELNRLMRERFMVRRDKKAVLKELPDKTRELILLPVDKLEKPIKKEKTRVENALASFEEMLGVDPNENPFRYIDAIDMLSSKLTAALDLQDSEEPDWNAAVRTLSEPEQIMFTELSEAREEVALAKVGLVTDHVKKLVESEEPVILFAYHKSVIAELKDRLTKAGIRVGVVTGAVSANKRQAVVDQFQDGEIDVIIGNILAMGVGFTLTRGRFVVFAELDWVPALIEQAEDRAWRHGQLNAVLIQHLVVDGSIESRMAMTLLEKMGVIFEALDERAAA